MLFIVIRCMFTQYKITMRDILHSHTRTHIYMLIHIQGKQMVTRNKTLKNSSSSGSGSGSRSSKKYGRRKKISYKSTSTIIAIAATAIHKINVHECSHGMLDIGGKKLHTTNFYFRSNFRVCVCKCMYMWFKMQNNVIVDDDDGVIEVFNRINIFRTHTIWVRVYV